MPRKLAALLILTALISGACAARSTHQEGILGISHHRRFLILGESKTPTRAAYYKMKYNALVWFTPSEGSFADSANKAVHSLVRGPSHEMSVLIAELESIDGSMGHWEILVPEESIKYVLATLKFMKTGSIKNARGTFHILKGIPFPAIEREIKRVGGGSFDVEYEAE